MNYGYGYTYIDTRWHVNKIQEIMYEQVVLYKEDQYPNHDGLSKKLASIPNEKNKPSL